MTRLPFRRVLLGALLGALGMFGIRILLAGSWPIQDSRPLHRWIVPLGAVLGVRLAVGKGGTARWVALLASLGLWEMFAWACLGWPSPDGEGFGVWYVLDLLILLGGWCVLVWRAMGKLEGGSLSMGALPLTLAGLFVANLMQGVVNGWIPRHLANSWLASLSMPAILPICIPGILFAVMLVGGLGSLAALAGRLDVRWGNACISAGLMGMAMASGWFLMTSYGGGPGWSDGWAVGSAFRLILELAWFSWWGWRLAKADGGD